MKIIIETVPHSAQRYDTVGDWQVIGPDHAWHISVSEMKNWRHEFLVALHELIEMAQCVDLNVKGSAVDAFDMKWKEHDLITEPGDDPKAPYYAMHQFACGLERTMASILGVNWTEYDKEVMSL